MDKDNRERLDLQITSLYTLASFLTLSVIITWSLYGIRVYKKHFNGRVLRKV